MIPPSSAKASMSDTVSTGLVETASKMVESLSLSDVPIIKTCGPLIVEALVIKEVGH